MKICIISPEIYPYTAGIGNVVMDLSTELAKDNTITIIAPNHTKSACFERKDGVDIIRINYIKTKSKILNKLQFIIKSLHYIKQNLQDYDVFFGNQLFPESLIAVLAARKFSKKSVIEAHGSDADIHAHKPILSKIIKTTIKNADLLLVLNEKHKNQFKDVAKKTVKVNNGILLNKLPSKTQLKKKLKLNSFSIVFAGNICENKGVIYAIKSVENLSFCELYIIGRDRSNSGYELKLRDYVKQHKIKNIHFLGEVSRNKTIEYIKAADIFLLPTFRESFGMVLVESMLNKTPIITTDVDDIKKTTGNLAHYVKPQNSDQITTQIQKIYTNKSDAINCAKNAEVFAHKKYAINNVADSFRQIFKKL